MKYITSAQKRECKSIIHTASLAAGAVSTGLAQLPGSDNAVISTIQLGMVIRIGRVFGMELEDSVAKAAIGSAASATIGRTISQCLVGWIPGFGNAINAGTAATITVMLGWLIAEDFSKRAVRSY